MPSLAFRDLPESAPVPIDKPKLIVAGPAGSKRDAFAVGRPARPAIVPVVIVGEVPQFSAIGSKNVDVSLLASGTSNQPFAVGRRVGKPELKRAAGNPLGFAHYFAG